ncbi:MULTISPECIES: peptidoglycan-binding protein [Streptomyces]|uniref:Peptidoglycan-binding protein n=1 Tax=Streptomyces koelreuteriae TaxID=2838015 RepID=A0ABX8FS24_9ACTN|nr:MULTISPECIES: peptidoglycan-binding protein [Streptomyces]QWB23881.1 peptidoglycan-binding protein [Streptomyces koelreuteriae]UUA06863.1 peptidoglycan-binding protein [Streptomyces koelreuteriae]UUA14492.1 peptidoglycan-binding protein [Streptomyces sp. CRCS-T-1]
MSRWKGLPEELDPRVRQLVVRLRRAKDHSGLSLRRLAARTGYSTSSWERYLSGRSLPPRDAVEAMARLDGDDPARLLALHEVAAEAWGTASEHRGPPAGPGTGPPPRPHGRALRITLIAGSVALVLAVATVVLLAVRLTDGAGKAAVTPLTASAATQVPGSPKRSERPTYTCVAERIDGRWYTGNSRTLKAVLAKGHAGPEVAEAQCLLHQAGFSPGAVDGIFGPHTQRAVKELQKHSGLVVDGIIGPHTWKALRR